MGFDMYWRDNGTPGDRDCDGPGYFRIGQFAMPDVVAEMMERGMVFDAGEPPPFPDVDWDLMERWQHPEFFEDKPPLTPEQEREAKEMRAAIDAMLSWHGPEIPGIPAHKFWTNDGWIVTPAECEAAVRIGRGHPGPGDDDDEVWGRWLDYMDRASRAGGFEVH